MPEYHEHQREHQRRRSLADSEERRQWRKQDNKRIGIIYALSLLGIIGTVIALLLLNGCASKNIPAGQLDNTFVSSTYNTLKTEGDAVNAAMQTMSDLYAKGQFSEAAKAKAVEAYKAFQSDYVKTVASLEAYVKGPSAANKQSAQTNIWALQAKAAGLAAMAVITK